MQNMFEITSDSDIAQLKMVYGKVNAMDIEFCKAMINQLDQLQSDGCRAVILTGQGSVFSAGIDLKRWLNEDSSYVRPFIDELETLLEVIFCFTKPIVAMINGHAIAGGCMMASACDYRIITQTARIGIPEMRVGVPLPMTAIEIMRFVANPSAFQRVVNVGATYAGQAAVDVGLADDVSETATIAEAVRRVARELAEIPLRVFQMTKKQARTPVLRRIRQNTADFRDEFMRIWSSNETRIAVQSYVDQRLGKRKRHD